jgi:PKD domain/CARDB
VGRHVAVLLALILIPSSFCFFTVQVHAEPTLIDVLTQLGFTNITESSMTTFPAGTYNITLYAEFASYCNANELSYYQKGTQNFLLIYSGPEGGSGYITPPLTKTFQADFEFGLSMLSPGPHRYFTEYQFNSDGQNHSRIYKNLDRPGMFLVGFENLYGQSNRDFQDMVFSLLPIGSPPQASFDWFPPLPTALETVTFNASASSANGGSITNCSWDFGDGHSQNASGPITTHVFDVSGEFNVTLVVTDSEGLTQSLTKTIVIASTVKHDVTILGVSVNTPHEYPGRIVNITVVVKNNGETSESFNITTYRDAVPIGSFAVNNLNVGDSRTVVCHWNTSGLAPYYNWTISAQAPLPNDVNPSDNILVDGQVYVKMYGDINANERIDLLDLVAGAIAFGSRPGEARWNPQADLVENGIINVFDLTMVLVHFNEVPPKP